jgi:hypothetical protein
MKNNNELTQVDAMLRIRYMTAYSEVVTNEVPIIMSNSTKSILYLNLR